MLILFFPNTVLSSSSSSSLDPDQAPSFWSKIVSMIRKYHNHKPKTNPWHREEEPHNHHETPGRQTKQSKQPALSSDPGRVDISSFRSTIRLFANRPSIGLFFILRGKNMAKYDIHIMESLPGILGNRRNDFYSRGTGNKGQILSGTGYKDNIGEHGT